MMGEKMKEKLNFRGRAETRALAGIDSMVGSALPNI
jgi:hypothetical protein